MLMNNKHSVTRGKLETFTLVMDTYSDKRERTIRVWLPDNYETSGDKRFPVMYMHDGQNLFDKYTSFVGEWEVDETISELIDEGYEGTIVVGIDNSADRLNELSPSRNRKRFGKIINNPSGELYASFIVKTLIPYINKHYKTKTEREHTGIGGSSMGGVMSLYMALEYASVFGYGLLFSTALHLYKKEAIKSFISAKVKKAPNLPRLYIYSGGAKYDTLIGPYVKKLYNYLVDASYNPSLLSISLDKDADHNEGAWAKHFKEGYSFLIDYKYK